MEDLGERAKELLEKQIKALYNFKKEWFVKEAKSMCLDGSITFLHDEYTNRMYIKFDTGKLDFETNCFIDTLIQEVEVAEMREHITEDEKDYIIEKIS